MTANTVSTRAVVKTFGSGASATRAVDGISLDVPAGTIFGLLGRNGAGKTTMIRMLTGILRPDAGDLTVLGSSTPEHMKAAIGYLPEEKGLYRKMRVLDFVTYIGRLKGLDRHTARRRAGIWLERFELGDRAAARCEDLSKGMGQKVQIAATLLHEPPLVVLDEPFSGLDPVNVELVRQLVLEMAAAGRTVILSTHIMEQAEQICQRLALIDHGRVLLSGTLAEVKRSHGRTVLLDYAGDLGAAVDLPGVVRANNAGQHAELTLADGADTQPLLAAIMQRVSVRRFDTREISLHEVFVRATGGGTVATEPAAAAPAGRVTAAAAQAAG